MQRYFASKKNKTKMFFYLNFRPIEGCKNFCMIDIKIVMMEICLLRWNFPRFFDEFCKIWWGSESYLQNVNKNKLPKLSKFWIQVKLLHV